MLCKCLVLETTKNKKNKIDCNTLWFFDVQWLMEYKWILKFHKQFHFAKISIDLIFGWSGGVLLWEKNFIRHYYIYYKNLQLTGVVLLMLLIPSYLYILSSNRDHVTMLRKVVGALPYSFHAITSGSIFREKPSFVQSRTFKKILFSSQKKKKWSFTCGSEYRVTTSWLILTN